MAEDTRKMIAEILQSARPSLEEIAQRAGVTYDTLYAWSTGRRNPSPDNLRRLMKALEDMGVGFTDQVEAVRASIPGPDELSRTVARGPEEAEFFLMYPPSFGGPSGPRNLRARTAHFPHLPDGIGVECPATRDRLSDYTDDELWQLFRAELARQTGRIYLSAGQVQEVELRSGTWTLIPARVYARPSGVCVSQRLTLFRDFDGGGHEVMSRKIPPLIDLVREDELKELVGNPDEREVRVGSERWDAWRNLSGIGALLRRESGRGEGRRIVRVGPEDLGDRGLGELSREEFLALFEEAGLE